MKLKQWGVTGIVLLAMSVWVTGPVVAGDLDSPGNPGSTMYTLEQIYERLDALETRIGDGGDAAADHGVGTADLEPTTAPAPTMHTLTDIYGKIDTIDGAIGGLIGDDPTWPTAPVPQTGQTTSYDSFDDGSLKKGVEWPDPRFTDNEDGTVRDNLTGLVWLQNVGCMPDVWWDQALENAFNLSAQDGGYTCDLDDGSSIGDWRMPNIRELYSLITFGGTSSLPVNHPFDGMPTTFWSSTTDAEDTDRSFRMAIVNGGTLSEKKDNNHALWPVRGPIEGTWPAPVPQTGQTESYDDNMGGTDDGDRQDGVPLPKPRFIDNEDGTVMDTLTGLVWMKNAGCRATTPFLSWEEALEYGWNFIQDGVCGLEDGSAPLDWRMPNILELHSLVSYTNDTDIYGLPTHHPFRNVADDGYYWSSTTSRTQVGRALGFRFGAGADFMHISHRISTLLKTTEDNYLWPVRDPLQDD